MRQEAREYALARGDEVDAMNEELLARGQALDSLLAATITVDDAIDLDRLKKEPQLTHFEPGSLADPAPLPDWSRFAPPPPTGLGKLFGKAKQEECFADAQHQFAAAQRQHEMGETDRRTRLREARTAFEEAQREETAEVEAHNRDIDSFKNDMAAVQPEALMQYFGMVLQASTYPEDFERAFGWRGSPTPASSSLNTSCPVSGSCPTSRSTGM